MDERDRSRFRARADYRSGERVVPAARSVAPAVTPAPPATPTAPVARQSREPKNISRLFKSHKKVVLLTLIFIVVVGIATASYFLVFHKSHKDQTGVLSASSTAFPVPLFQVKNLPKGYKFNNDAKALKADVYYFSVTDSAKHIFYITQQPIPVTFDFNAFNKKFLNPDTFVTSAGSVVAGPAGNNMIASIRTTKNTWILVNTSSGTSLSNLETVVRSLQ